MLPSIAADTAALPLVISSPQPTASKKKPTLLIMTQGSELLSSGRHGDKQNLSDSHAVISAPLLVLAVVCRQMLSYAVQATAVQSAILSSRKMQAVVQAVAAAVKQAATAQRGMHKRVTASANIKHQQ